MSRYVYFVSVCPVEIQLLSQEHNEIITLFAISRIFISDCFKSFVHFYNSALNCNISMNTHSV